MTDPVPSPACTQPPQEAQPQDRTGPSRKTIIGWTAVMLAALGLAWFIGAVAVPVFRTRAAVDRLSTSD